MDLRLLLSRGRRAAPGALLLALAAATAASAQGRVEGRVVSAATGEPVALALVSVPETPLQALAGEDGAWSLEGTAAGPLRLRVEQVGYATLDTTVEAGAAALVLRLTPRPIAMEGVVAQADPPECTRRGFRGRGSTPQAVAAMEELRKNAERYRLMLDRFPVRVRWEQHHQYLDRAGQMIEESRDTLQMTSDGARSVYRVGNVLRRGRDGQPEFAIPSLYALAQPEFEQNHCFRYAGMETVDGRRVHRIEFTPAASVTDPDVEGHLLLDAQTAFLRVSEFRLTRVPEGARFRNVTMRTNYREIAPSIPIPEGSVLSQQFSGVRMQGQPLGGSRRQWRLLDYGFTGARPGG